MISDTFPEVYRSLKQEFSIKRIRNTALLAWLVGLSSLLMSFSDADGLAIVPKSAQGAEKFIRGFWWLLGTVWGLYGCIEILNSLARERSEGTWDLQRLTPLSSFRMAGGKLLGPLLFPSFVALLLLPFFVFGVAYSGSEGLEWSLRAVPQTLLFLVFGFCFSLLASCYVGSRRSAGLVIVFLVILANVYFSSIGSNNQSFYTQPAMLLFGVALSNYQYFNLVAAFFAAWSFKGAQWIFGGELLEAPKFWRIPIFVLFLIAFGAAHQWYINDAGTLEARALWLGTLLATLFCYVSAFFDSPTIDKIRKGLMFSKGLERLHRLPNWTLATTSLALGLWLAVSLVDLSSNEQVQGLALLPLFVLRDMLIYQWVCLSDSRRPQAVTIIVLALIYIVPNYMVRLFEVDQLGALFSPASSKADLSVRIAAPLIQAALLAIVLRLRFKKSLA
jgi:hypothetical protein